MSRKFDTLEEKDEAFWRKVSNVKTDHVLIHMVLTEIRNCNILEETNQVKMTRLSKMKALVDLIDIEKFNRSTNEVVDSDDELLEAIREY